MAKRQIIKIDEEKCDGCGLCIPNCPEGALQVIDGKARLISDLFCDGLGACIGHCPKEAITIEEREAEEYDEKKVMENIVKKGANTIKAHLEHLQEHGETEYLNQAKEILKEKNIEIEGEKMEKCGCPGAKRMEFPDPKKKRDKDLKTKTMARAAAPSLPNRAIFQRKRCPVISRLRRIFYR